MPSYRDLPAEGSQYSTGRPTTSGHGVLAANCLAADAPAPIRVRRRRAEGSVHRYLRSTALCFRGELRIVTGL